MSNNKEKKSYALEVTLIVMAIAVAFFVGDFIKSTTPPKLPDFNGKRSAAGDGEYDGDSAEKIAEEKKDLVPEEYKSHLSDLGLEPDWGVLDDYQFTIKKDDFTRLLDKVYTLRGSWEKWVDISDDYATIRTHANDESLSFQLHFASEEKQEDVKRYWRSRDTIKHSDGDLPLGGVRIVIDAGHIGGNYASVEERNFKYNETAPVNEGNLTLTVAKQLEQQLKVLGALVDLTRSENKPVNPRRAEDYLKYAKSKMESRGELISDDAVMRVSERLFYRADEIRERAKIVNKEFKPDLVVCIHFNAEAWDETKLIENEHAHMILHGAYTSGELEKDDQRLQMLQKIVQRCHEEERKVSASVASAMAMHTGLPPYTYEPMSYRAVNVDNNPYLWARNLAANRAYQCPVIFCEPYLMNGSDSHARIQAGDYEGLRYVNKMLRPSIFREYVNSVTEGLVNYYQKREISE